MNYESYILNTLPFTPTEGQQNLIGVFSSFMTDSNPRTAMVLRGSAGTGKTSVARGIVAALRSLRQKVLLMAPTGRAAKVMGDATTIHRRIYRQQSYLSESFLLTDNLHADTLFIIDEASMISAMPSQGWTGNSLLDDLVAYVYSGRNCRMLLIGDTAQLPPIGSDEAPALITDYIQGYGLNTYECDLTQVLRQSQESGILWNATMLRHLITYDEMTELPRIRFQGFADISICYGNDLIDQLSSSYYHVGTDETIVITRSNKRANTFNNGIRNQVFDREEELSRGDQLMIVKNNYYWTALSGSRESEDRRRTNDQNAAGSASEAHPSPVFLANGDRCVVQRVRNVRHLYGFRFADATITLPDYDDTELQATILLDTLQSEAPALSERQQDMLYDSIMMDYADLTTKVARAEAMKKDVYFNALQIKYAYAVTCHKAQGGQWQHVYLDQGYMTDEMVTPAYIHWLYTAFTRATEHLYLVNWPKVQVNA